MNKNEIRLTGDTHIKEHFIDAEGLKKMIKIVTHLFHLFDANVVWKEIQHIIDVYGRRFE